MEKFLTKCMMITVVIAGFTGLVAVGGEKSSDGCLKVGTFDSRLVAFAYYRSDVFMTEINNLKLKHKEATEAGDTEIASGYQAKGEKMQDLGHKQVFGTMDIDELLEEHKKDIQKIAKEAGVDIVISKWDILCLPENAEFTDLTEELMKIFNSDEKFLTDAMQLKNTEPVPMKELETHKHY